LGCKVARSYIKALRFCDDLSFLAPTRYAMKLILYIFQKSATKFYLQVPTYFNHARPNSSVSVVGLKAGQKSVNIMLEVASKD
jgi:hypothetical protein